MVVATVEFRNIAGTEAALGWAGSHTVVVDRPEGKAGGKDLGFNGAQLLGLAIGGCYCNDLRYVAHNLGHEIGEISVRVTVNLEGSPLIATKADVEVHLEMSDGGDPSDLIKKAWEVCTVANSLRRGIPVSLTNVGQDL
ncbi:OsmC family protein [Pseudaminobacter soli (ex Li et al. 2025)]|uniref:Oxidoreductase n=1 Tax=Pseudaminobacter soli (ex Li et al. 2025) TaxID=1295366 RepID=A0A2P7RZX0_9HYPH|nr:OsmC family protein [Mesorhizobium soli]PSJ55775.1 oxidoreductase [Mesorhizobium soli]